MTYARIIPAAITVALFSFLAPPTVSGAAIDKVSTPAPPEVNVAPAAAPSPVEATEIIDGVRILAPTEALHDSVSSALATFADAGWPIHNTEIRWSDDECNGAVAFHAEERGHHVIVMCTDAEWTLLHELGHVWSDLYLDDEAKTEWVHRRGLDSWHEGAYDDRGTEQAAQAIAFGLYSEARVPSRGGADYHTMVEDFMWLFGMDPIHRQRTTGVGVQAATDPQAATAVSSAVAPMSIPS